MDKIMHTLNETEREVRELKEAMSKTNDETKGMSQDRWRTEATPGALMKAKRFTSHPGTAKKVADHILETHRNDGKAGDDRVDALCDMLSELTGKKHPGTTDPFDQRCRELSEREKITYVEAADRLCRER